MQLFSEIKAWQLWMLSVTLSMILTECIVVIMETLLKGTVTSADLITGLVATLVVVSLVVSLFNYLLKETIKIMQMQLQSTLKVMPDLLFEVDAKAEVQDYHIHQTELLTVPLEAVIGQLISAVLPADIANVCLSALHEAQQQGWSVGKQYSFTLAKETRWFELSVTIKSAEEDEDPRFIVVSRDITQQKKNQLALQEAMQRLEKIAGRVPGMVYQFRRDVYGSYCFPYASPAMYDIFQVHPEEVRSSAEKVLALIHPDDYEEMIRSMTQSAENLTAWQHEFRLRFADGTLRWLYGNALPQRGFDGSTLWHGFVTDITESKNRDIEYQAILEVTLNGFWCNDFSGRFLTVNPALCKMLGYSSEELLTMTIADIEIIEQPEEVEAHLQKVIEQGHDTFESAHRRKDGVIITVEVNVLYLPELGERVFVFVNDISQRDKAEKELKESEERFRLGFDNANIGMCLIDTDGGIFKVNQQMCEMFGYSKLEMETMRVNDIAHPDHFRASFEFMRNAKEGKVDHAEFEKKYTHKQGHDVWGLVSSSLVRNSKGEPLYFISHVLDITERKHADTELRIAATVFESQEGMMIMDANGTFIKVNQAFTHITGYSEAEVIGQNPRMLNSERHDKAFYEAMWESIYDTGAWQGEIWNRLKNGNIYPEWLTITAVSGNSSGTITHYVATLTDITDRKNAEEMINRLAFYDPLTNLPNRRLLHERIKHGIEICYRSGKEMAVMMMDLDKFKVVNDTLGHSAGDELLQQVAVRISHRLREVDTVARLGGDEFVILIEDVPDCQNVGLLAQMIIETLSESFTLRESYQAHIGASIGIAMYPKHGDSLEALMDNADTALYHAKDNGRGCYAYFSAELIAKRA